MFYNFNNTCYQTCPDGMYGVDATNLCMACDSICSKCTNGANNTCTECHSGYFLQYGTNTCVEICPGGQY